MNAMKPTKNGKVCFLWIMIQWNQNSMRLVTGNRNLVLVLPNDRRQSLRLLVPIESQVKEW